jgi:hypothetical protein
VLLTTNGGTSWTNLAALDAMMTGSGLFRARPTRGSWDWVGFTSYPQPSLLAFDAKRANWIIAGAVDAGVFLSTDHGANWNILTDPIDPAGSGIAHLPRPLYAYVDHDGTTRISDVARIFVGTQGRGVWRLTRTERSPFFSFCARYNINCPEPRFGPGLIVLECDRVPCAFRDPLPRNCLVKFSCPPCSRGRLCPAFHNFELDGLDLTKWEVGVYTGEGEPVDFELTPTRTGAVVSFRPDSSKYVNRLIGDYMLGFALRPGAAPGRYRVRTRLSVSDRVYSEHVALSGRPRAEEVSRPK